MANYEATKYDFSGANLTGIQGVNTGIIVPWSDTSVPSGFLECAGAAVSRTTYADLFAVIGTTYGSGDGSTTFNLPDLTDRIVVSQSPNKTLASTGGANTVTGDGNIAGTVGNTTIATPTLASHSHPTTITPTTGGGRFDSADPDQPIVSAGSLGPPAQRIGNTGGGGAHTHPGSLSFTGDATSVLQPYLTVMYIIKT